VPGDGGPVRSEAPDGLVAPADGEPPLDEGVAADPEEAGGAGVPVEGLGSAGAGAGVGAGIGSDTVGAGRGGIAGVGTGSGSGSGNGNGAGGGGGGDVGSGSETVGSETVIGGRPTSPSACAENRPAAAVTHETARIRANFVSRRMTYTGRTEVRPRRLRATPAEWKSGSEGYAIL
jgi:hypothetical protein